MFGNHQRRSGRALVALLAGLSAAALVASCGQAAGQEASSNRRSVALVTPERAGDGGPTDQMLAGLERAKAEFGLKTRHIEATDTSTYESTLRNLGQAKQDVVIVAYTGFTEAITAVAPEFPDTHWIHLYADPRTEEISNVRTISYDTGAPGFLAGVLAATATGASKVGFVGGDASPQVNADYHAFVAGVRATDPAVQVLGAVVGSWSDPVKGQQVAQTLLARGADVVLSYGGGSSVGVVKAARQSGGLVVTDTLESQDGADVVVGTASQNYDVTVYQQLSEVQGENWKPGHLVANLSNDGTALNKAKLFRGTSAKGPEAKLPTAWTAVDKARQGIIDQKITVPFDTTGF
jgi:basic membrane protein A and related proteins